MPMEQAQPAAKTIVLVTNQFQCERLIHAGRALADVTGTEPCVLSVQSSLYPQNPLALEHLFHVSKQNGAEMHVAYGEDPARQIIHFIKHNKAHTVVSGMPKDERSMLYVIWRKFTHIRFFTVDEEGSIQEAALREEPVHRGAILA